MLFAAGGVQAQARPGFDYRPARVYTCDMDSKRLLNLAGDRRHSLPASARKA